MAALPLPCDMAILALKAEALDGSTVEQRYEFGAADFLGNGTYGRVYGALVLPEKTQKVALKVMDCRRYTSGRERALREPIFLKRTSALLPQHPNLLHFYSAHEQVVDIDRFTGQPLYTLAVATTFAPGGDLMNHIEAILRNAPRGTFAQTFTELFVARIIKTLATTIDQLHDASILHLDLKPDNMLLRVPVRAAEGFEPERDIVICDVGMAAYKQEVSRADYVQYRANHQGTAQFSAPEQYYPPHACCAASDAWSIGCITFGLLTWHNAFSRPPHPGTQVRVEDVRQTLPLHAQQAWDELTEDAHDFVSRLLVVDPAARMSVKQMLGHPFLTQLDLPPASLSSGSTRSLPATIRNASAASQGSQVIAVVSGVLQLAGTFMGALWERAVSVVGEAGSGAGAVPASGNPASELDRLRQAFLQQVGSREGVGLEEFRAIFRAADVPLNDDMIATHLFRLMDTDRSGTVSYLELQAGMSSLSRGDESTLDFVFDMFDQDGSGTIDIAEMGKMAASTGILARGQRSLAATVRAATAMPAGSSATPAPSPARSSAILARAASHSEAMSSATAALQALFTRIDTNRDGKIDRREFKAACEAEPALRETLLAPLKAIAAVHAEAVLAAQVEDMVHFLHAK